MERQELIAGEVASMMEILKVTNAQTSMGMSELIDVYALAKPGMDAYKWAIEDQIEIVKLASNTASVFGMSAEELSSGIDDLAAGTWVATSGFGKMMKAIKVSKEEYQAAGDKVAYLKNKMKETGEAQDTWAAAVSKFQVAWDTMAGQVTQPIFDGIKEALNVITVQMNESGPAAMQIFADALIGMVNGGIKAFGFLAKVINQTIGLMQIAYSGYQKYAGLMMGGDTTKLVKRLESQLVGQEYDRNNGGARADYWEESTKSLIKQITKLEEYNTLRRAGDKNHEEALKRTNAINELVNNGVKNFTIETSAVKTIKETAAATDALAYKVNTLAGTTDKVTKSGKAASKALKEMGTQDIELVRVGGLEQVEEAAEETADIFENAFSGAFYDLLDGKALSLQERYIRI